MRLLRQVVLLLIALGPCALAQTIALESWDFVTDPSAKLAVSSLKSVTGWRTARAGLSWQAQSEDLRDYSGVAWYRTSIDVPRFDRARRVLLRFGAVDYRAEVFVNGRSAFQHEGGYTPFVVDITDDVHAGPNEIAVRVLDPPNKGEAEGIRYKEIPHGKQNWYVQTSGLWQPVTLEFRPETYVEDLLITPEPNGRVEVDVLLNEAPREGRARVVIKNRHGKDVFTAVIPGGTQKQYRIPAQVADPELWSPEDPALYTVEAEFSDRGGVADTLRARFGFRRLETRDGKLFLNGKPFYMIGALDQDFYPDTIYSPPSREYVRREMQLAKKLGLNTLRCHIKVCEPEYLDAADEEGIVVWYEIPNWDDFTADSARRGEATLAAMLARDRNHPSLLIQSLINESWGIDLTKQDQRAWLRDMTERAQAAVQNMGRLIVDNSPCCENFHVRTDLDDFHQYYSIPDNAAKWDAWVADFASRPRWSFSQHGDAQRTGKEPLIVSEFGNWGLPQLPSPMPWWFPRSNAEITRPGGVFDRFHEFKFDRIFRDYGELARATEWHQFLSLKHEIEEMRRYGSIQGYVITEFTDINWESNGLLTMWREPKVYADELARIQQPDVVLARLPHSFGAGEVVTADLFLSHYSMRTLKGATLFWHTDSGQSGRVPVGSDPAAGSVIALGRISFHAQVPGASALSVARLDLEVRDASGAVIATNNYPFNVFQLQRPPNSAVAVYDPSRRLPRLRGQLESGGHQAKDSASVTLATTWDEHVNDSLARGGRVIILADRGDALPSGVSVQLKERKDDYDGNWVSNFAWVDPQSPVFGGITAGPILGWEAAAVTPRFVLRGVRGEDYDDVLSGMFYGWINLNSPLLMQARVGSGAVLVTTFRFDQYGVDPFATALLNALVRYAASPEFRPRMEWSR